MKLEVSDLDEIGKCDLTATQTKQFLNIVLCSIYFNIAPI